jgi:uncharacterized cupredoxin-like copper-binding protein
MAALGLLAAACGGGSGTGGGHDHDAAADDGHDHSHDAGASGSFSFGEPAQASDADRTIKVTGTDELRFEPDEIDIEVGETVAFEFVNAGKGPHELVIGDAAAMGGHAHGTAAPNATSTVEGGDSATIAWTFSQAGDFVFECHVADHHKLGMRGTITVS